MNLDTQLTDILPRVLESQKKALRKLGVSKVLDLLYHFPTRYGDISEMRNIASLQGGESAVIFGKIRNLKTSKAYKKKIPMADGIIEDDSGSIKTIWFNQPYIAKLIGDGALVRAEGKVSVRKKDGEKYLSNPKIEKVTKIPTGVGDSLFGEQAKDEHTLHPIYPESRGITSNWIQHAIVKVLKTGILEKIEDPLPEEILKKYNLPKLQTALLWIHSPKNKNDASVARKRFAFEEVFYIQLDRQKARLEYQKNPSFKIETSKKNISDFISRFPFTATDSQMDSIDSILNDFEKGHAMSRLLEGDVGSGKTAVAATTAFSVVTTRPKNQDYGNLQVAYMVPTEILAKQQFENFIQYFSYLGINVGLITGDKCRKFPSKINPKGWTDISRSQLLKWVANGEIPILVGTHSLIQKTVKFKHLAYVVIDEQHRFGVAQRQKLTRKNEIAPHLLSMTATPIPRTLALTIYGDLDLTVIDQMPTGRKPIITEIVLPTKREEVYERIRKELKAGRQAYVICPRIDEPDPDKEMSVQAKSAIAEAKRLKDKIFPEYEIGVLHSKMKPKEKEEVMKDFSENKTQILTATSVVEVGVNVPNATVIIIEGAERFGLAQLHQLRGRVIRSNHQAYCYVFTESASAKTVARLKALKTAKNGFELAEEDLKLRGPGELSGNKQWGISDMGMEALKNIKMVELAREEAKRLIEEDDSLSKYPLLQKKLEERKSDEIHFE